MNNIILYRIVLKGGKGANYAYTILEFKLAYPYKNSPSGWKLFKLALGAENMMINASICARQEILKKWKIHIFFGRHVAFFH